MDTINPSLSLINSSFDALKAEKEQLEKERQARKKPSSVPELPKLNQSEAAGLLNDKLALNISTNDLENVSTSKSPFVFRIPANHHKYAGFLLVKDGQIHYQPETLVLNSEYRVNSISDIAKAVENEKFGAESSLVFGIFILIFAAVFMTGSLSQIATYAIYAFTAIAFTCIITGLLRHFRMRSLIKYGTTVL